MEQSAKGLKPGGVVRRQRRGAVLILMLDHPPANAITRPLMSALTNALEAARDEPGLRAVILLGMGRGFSAGMHPDDLGQAAAARDLAALTARIETFPLPIIAALHGTCFGAGLEIAIAAHLRIAGEAARLSLPEVNLGLPPCGGATQRLPRLIGGRQALRLLLTAPVISAAEALALGLVDHVATGDLLTEAIALAEGDIVRRETGQLTGAMGDLFGPGGAVGQARAVVPGAHLPAAGRIVDCVEAAGLLPLDLGLQLEATAFADLAATEAAVGLRSAFVAERRVMQVPADVAAVGAVAVGHLGLWSPPEAMAGLLVRALGAGIKISIAAETREALVSLLNLVAAAQDGLVAAGKLTETARDAEWALLSASLGADALAGCDLVLTGTNPPVALPAALCLSLGGLAMGQTGVAMTLPDQSGGLAEIAVQRPADLRLAAMALGLARRLGARAVFTGPGGPAEARLTYAFSQAIAEVEAAGVDRAALTAALAAFGTGLGPDARALPPMPPGGDAIVTTCLNALAAEGGRLLDDGTLSRPLEVDALALQAGLVPRWQGGPMAWAHRRGLLVVRADLKARPGALYAVPQIFDRLISEGRSLADLNRKSAAT